MSTRRERAAKGLCPACGEEAAPYYLCAKHRFEQQIVRRLERGAREGGFKKEGRGQSALWSIGSEAALDAMVWRDPKDGDKRFRPRLGRIPVEVEDELVKLLHNLGRPASIDEIVAAWGQLREKRKAGTIAANMAQIIAAQQRREARNAKRLRAALTPDPRQRESA
jgi:hypothetical protein